MHASWPDLDASLQALLPEVRALRRTFHAAPELSLHEHETQRTILEYLTALGLTEVGAIAGTGVKAVVRAKTGPGTPVALRADMDALPVEERSNAAYASRRKGVMHACGHDGHMAMLLALAKWLTSNPERQRDDVVLLFQPAEEGFGGAARMLAEGGLRDPKVEAIFGLHLNPELPVGHLGCLTGAMLAAVHDFDVVFSGRGGHAAMPHHADDLLACIAELVQTLHFLVARRVDPFSQAVLTIGRIDGWAGRNVLPERLALEGTLRTRDDGVAASLRELLSETVDQVARVHGVRAELHWVRHYPSLRNHPGLVGGLAEMVGPKLVPMTPLMGGEDFAFYQAEVPGLFVFVGTRDETAGTVHPLHSPGFDFDEAALLTGVALFRDVLVGRCHRRWLAG